MVTMTPLSNLKRVKAPRRRFASFTRFVIESVLFSNLITATLTTKSPEFMLTELKEFSLARKLARPRAPKLDIRLSTGQKIGVQIGSLQKDL